MRAVILAAGQGTRLRPITNERPKCLVELAGRSLLELQLAALRRARVEDITVVGGYRAESIEMLGVPVLRNPAYDRTNMVETLFCAESLMTGDTDLLVSYGDIVFEPSVVEAVRDCEAPVCLPIDENWREYWALRFDDPLSDAETLKRDADGFITEIGKKPRGYDEIQGQYIGLIKFSADRVEALISVRNSMDRSRTYDGQDFANMYMTSFLQHLIDVGWRIRGVPIRNRWLETDSVADLEMYNEMARSGSLDAFYRLSSVADEPLPRP